MSVSKEPFAGVFPILVTPFREDCQVDEASLRDLVEFSIEAGVHGLGFALHSEVYKLSESERAQVTKVVVEQAHGRVPIVVNTGAESNQLAILYSRMAETNGADALMLCPPMLTIGNVGLMKKFYKTVSDATPLPIFVQDTTKTPVAPSAVVDISRVCKTLRYLKVESSPTTVKIADAVEYVGDTMTVFGGAAGGLFVEELNRGSRGTMPGCGQPEAFVEVWNLYQQNRQQAARDAFTRQILPVNRFRAMTAAPFHAVDKEVLRFRGIIRSSYVRQPTVEMDERTRQELRETLEGLYGPPVS